MTVHLFCSLAEQTVELEIGEGVDGNVGIAPLLTNSKILITWMDLCVFMCVQNNDENGIK